MPACLVAAALAGAAPADESAPERRLDCVIEPSRVVNVSTAVEGVLSEVAVEKGDVVAEGQVIATLQSEVEQAAVELAEMRVAMNAQIAARKAELESARRKVKRSTELGDQSFISSEMLDQIRTEFDIARLDYESALENKRMAAAELERARAQYRLRVIRSPIDGIVLERFLSEGEFAQAQDIVRIARIDPLHVEAVAPIGLFGAVEPGMKAQVTPEAPLSGSYEATVRIVDRVVDAASGLFRIRLEMPNPGGALPAGIECSVSFDPVTGP